MSQELDNLKNEVTEATTVQASAAALLSGLKGRLDTAIAELQAQGVTNEALNQLSSDLDTSSNALQEAIVANTPAA